jgi:hypothetical protein
VIKRLGLLIGGSLLFGGAVAYPAYCLAGEAGLVFNAVALALCLIPAAATMLLAEWSFRKSPDMFLLAVLGGTGVRMFVVLGAAWVICQGQPYFQDMGFIVSVGVFYLFTLALEMVALLSGRVGAGERGSSSRG